MGAGEPWRPTDPDDDRRRLPRRSGDEAGAACAIWQSLGWKHSPHAKPRSAPRSYVTIAVLTALAVAFNFLDVIRCPRWSSPELRVANVPGYATLAVSGAAVIGLVASRPL